MTDTAIAVLPAEEAKPFQYRRTLHNLAFWCVILGVACVVLIAGLLLRRYAWDQTEPIRYVADINNAFRQGTYTLQSGFIERYDLQESTPDKNPIMALDYAPGRLAVATLWTWWVRDRVDPVPTGEKEYLDWSEEFYYFARNEHRQYELCQPLLMVNVAGELLSAIAIFFLVRRYTMGKPPVSRPKRGAILGLIAATFFWFSPGLICNAHCWPQWDSWLMPFFLWGVLLASLDWWFCAGLVIALGAMFKAQILFGGPLFVMWPLFQCGLDVLAVVSLVVLELLYSMGFLAMPAGHDLLPQVRKRIFSGLERLTAIVRWIVGMMTGVAAVAAVWLVREPGHWPEGLEYIPSQINPAALEWVIYLAVLFAAMVPLLLWPKQPGARIPVGVAVAGVITWIIGAYAGHVFSVVGFLVLATCGVVADQTCNSWNWRARLPLGWIAIAILFYPIYALARDWVVLTAIATVAVGFLICLAPRRVIPYAAVAWIAAGVLMCSPIFNTSTSWFHRGFEFGTYNHEKMASEDNNNLAELLKNKWKWDDLMLPVLKISKGPFADRVAHFMTSSDPHVKKDLVQGAEKPTGDQNEDSENEFIHLGPGEVGLPIKYLLLGLWVLSIIVCAIGTAIQDRRRSPRFLVSIAAPWITFFAVMAQMHQRYLLWGSSISAASAVLSPGYAVLHVFLSVVSMGQELTSMMSNHLDGFHPVNFTNHPVYIFFHKWHPGVSWAVLLTACIFVYSSVKPDRVRSPKSETRSPEEIFTAETHRRREEQKEIHSRMDTNAHE